MATKLDCKNLNAAVKKPLPQPPFQRNLSNAAGQKK
jgi:hypothetical protein